MLAMRIICPSARAVIALRGPGRPAESRRYTRCNKVLASGSRTTSATWRPGV